MGDAAVATDAVLTWHACSRLCAALSVLTNLSVACAWEGGADQCTAKGVQIKTTDDTAGGVATEVKTRFSFGALDLVDAIGNSVLFNLSLPTTQG